MYKFEFIVGNLPVLTTTSISYITQNSAQSGGTIINSGGSSISLKGVCWSTSPNPTTQVSSGSSGAGSFIQQITGLIPGQIYYVRAYAKNALITKYGDQYTFTTIPTLPEWGLIAFGAMIALFGGWFVWKRS